jgi:hypothetical protein
MGRLLIGLAPPARLAVLLASLALLLALLLLLTAPARAGVNDFEASADVLAVASDGTRSFLDNGLGELRFDDHHEGLQLDNVRFGYKGELAEIVHFTVQAVSYGDRQSNPLDLTEAFAEIRPFPTGPWRSRLKIGAFYAPISMENRLQGWRSAYSLSPSAINTWVGEELRTFGAEYDLDWLGRQRGHDWELGVGAAVYGWNESAGQLMAERGWAIHDRQATVFGKIGEPTGPIFDQRLLSAEGDDRAGYYLDATASYLDTLELRALHYDNRANTDDYSQARNEFPWLTQFDSAGARWTPSANWTVISQWLSGRTCVDSEDEFYCWHFDSEFLLASWSRGPDRISGRYDRFEMHQSLPEGDDDEDSYSDNGHAWTFAYQHEINQHLSLALEFLQIDSRLPAREEIDAPVYADEREVQLAFRLQL